MYIKNANKWNEKLRENMVSRQNFIRLFEGPHDILTEVYVEIHTHNTVPKTMSEAVTVLLLPKKSKS